MNLMFWKKQGATDETGAETPAEAGLAARMRSWLDGLTGHFKRTPAFRAEAEPDMSGGPKKSDDAAPVESGPEAPVKLGLGVRMKLQLIALMRRFRKTPAPDTEEEQGEEAGEAPGPETPAKPGLLARIRAGFAAFIREIKAPATPAADEEEEADAHGRSAALPEEALEGGPGAGPVRSRKWLVVGGSILIVALLAVDIAITLWLAYEPQQKRWGTRHDITSISSRPLDSESTQEEPLNEIEALKKENAALQARIEALKKEPPRPDAAPAWQSGGGKNIPPTALSGEMAVGNSDPKAAAMTLKEAIEAMNAASGDYRKKPAK